MNTLENAETRQCKKCGEIKPISEFYNRLSRGKPSKYALCRICYTARSRAAKEKTKIKVLTHYGGGKLACVI